MLCKSNSISAKDYKSNLISFYSEKERKMKYPVVCVKVFKNECRQLPSAPLGKTFCETAIIVEVNLSNFYHISSVIKKGSYKRNRLFGFCMFAELIMFTWTRLPYFWELLKDNECLFAVLALKKTDPWGLPGFAFSFQFTFTDVWILFLCAKKSYFHLSWESFAWVYRFEILW